MKGDIDIQLRHNSAKIANVIGTQMPEPIGIHEASANMVNHHLTVPNHCIFVVRSAALTGRRRQRQNSCELDRYRLVGRYDLAGKEA